MIEESGKASNPNPRPPPTKFGNSNVNSLKFIRLKKRERWQERAPSFKKKKKMELWKYKCEYIILKNFIRFKKKIKHKWQEMIIEMISWMRIYIN